MNALTFQKVSNEDMISFRKQNNIKFFRVIDCGRHLK